MKLARDNGLETHRLITDMQDTSLYQTIYNNSKRINDAGFYETPSVVINNKVVWDPSSVVEIETILEYELSLSE